MTQRVRVLQRWADDQQEGTGRRNSEEGPNGREGQEIPVGGKACAFCPSDNVE